MKFDRKKIFFTVGMGGLLLIATVWLLIRAFSAGFNDDKKLYYIGRDSTWYPVDLRGKEKNMVGFANDLIQAIGKEMGFRAVVIEVGPNALFDGLHIESYDAIFSSLTPNVINLERYGFSNPFYQIGPVLIVRSDSGINSLNEMEGKILGIETGALQAFDLPEPIDIVILPFNTSSEALENLDRNFIDGVIIDVLRAHTYTEGYYASRLRVATDPLTKMGLRIVTRKDPQSIRLITLYNEGLKAVKEKGIYSQLIEKWELINTDIKEEQPT